MHSVNVLLEDDVLASLTDSHISHNDSMAYALQHRLLHHGLDRTVDHTGILFNLIDGPGS